MPLLLHLVHLAGAVAAICLVSAFIVEADDRAALRSMPRRFATFFGASALLLTLAYFGPL